jgi:hypothetical protein
LANRHAACRAVNKVGELELEKYFCKPFNKLKADMLLLWAFSKYGTINKKSKTGRT